MIYSLDVLYFSRLLFWVFETRKNCFKLCSLIFRTKPKTKKPNCINLMHTKKLVYTLMENQSHYTLNDIKLHTLTYKYYILVIDWFTFALTLWFSNSFFYYSTLLLLFGFTSAWSDINVGMGDICTFALLIWFCVPACTKFSFCLRWKNIFCF